MDRRLARRMGLPAVVLVVVVLALAGLPEPGGRGAAAGPAAQDVDVSHRDGVTAGRLVDGTAYSATLAMDLPYRVYLPPGYGATLARYPVLYMLHGGGSNYLEWTEKSHLGNIVDSFIAQGRIPPMIIVMPEADYSYYVNQPNRGRRWADHMVYDLVSFVDFTYRTVPDRARRAIGGMSMGGSGALQLAMNHPEVFSAAGAHSGALFLSSEGMPAVLGSWDYYAAYDPLRLAATRDGLGALKIWLDVGDQDLAWRPGMERLHSLLSERGLQHQWRVYPGGHDNTFWMNHLPDYLKFYADALSGVTPPTPTPAPPTATSAPLAPDPLEDPPLLPVPDVPPADDFDSPPDARGAESGDAPVESGLDQVGDLQATPVEVIGGDAGL